MVYEQDRTELDFLKEGRRIKRRVRRREKEEERQKMRQI